MSEENSNSAESVESTIADDQTESEEDPKKPANPWASPRLEPVNGIVQPRFIPPVGKPVRHTNQLDFLMNNIMKDAMKHKHSWPFHNPVDSIKLSIPEYHNVVHKPMDLKTIEKRLKHVYYYSSKEAIEDLMTMFNNCYTFNPPHYGVYAMAKGLEEYMLGRLSELPEGEIEIDRPVVKRGPKGRGGAKNVGNRGTPVGSKRKVVQPEGESSHSRLAPEDQHVIDHFHRATRGGSVSRESSVISIQQKDADSSIDVQDDSMTASTSEATNEVAPKGGTKGVKRKADTTTLEDEPGGKMAARRESTRPIKKPALFIDFDTVQPRLKGKMTESLRFCQKLINELFTKKYKSFCWPFYEPVDVEALNVADYYDIITHPMDLGTMKKKLESRQYINAQEFADDLRLICRNCTTYNSKGTAVHHHGLELLKTFEKKFKDCPVDEATPEPQPPVLSIQTDAGEDERISLYIAAVKTEQKKLSDSLEMLRGLGESLYDIAMQRRDAKLNGTAAPLLNPSHLSQLEKLGLLSGSVGKGDTRLSTPKPELISPSASIRSSGRAPVPKVFDDAKVDFAIAKPPRKNARQTQNVVVTPIKPYCGRGRRPGSKNRPKVPKKEYEFDSDDDSTFTPLSYDDKVDLSREVSSLSGDGVAGVMKIIEKRCPKYYEQILKQDEIEIDFEKIDLVTLHELQVYIKSVSGKDKKPKKLMPIRDPVAAEKKRLELERELENLNGTSANGKESSVPRTDKKSMSPKANKPVAPRPAIPSTSTAKHNMSSDSSESSSSSSSESSDSSDSEDGPRDNEWSGNRFLGTSNGKAVTAAQKSKSPSPATPTPPASAAPVKAASPVASAAASPSLSASGSPGASSGSSPDRSRPMSPISAAATPSPEPPSAPAPIPPPIPPKRIVVPPSIGSLVDKAPLPSNTAASSSGNDPSQIRKPIKKKPLVPKKPAVSGGIGVSILDSLLPETPIGSENGSSNPAEEEEDQESEDDRIRRLQAEARRRRDEEENEHGNYADQRELMLNFESSF